MNVQVNSGVLSAPAKTYTSNFKLDVNSCEFRASSPLTDNNIPNFEPDLKTAQSVKTPISDNNSVEYNSDASTQADDLESNTSSPQKTKETIKIKKFSNNIN